MSMNGLTSTWGPQRLVKDQSLNDKMVNAAHQWFTGDLSLDGVRDVAAKIPRSSHISMVVNNECNQNCTHCFIQLPKLGRERLTPDEWHRTLQSSVLSDIGQYVIAGKEALVGTTGPAVISYLGELRAQRPCVYTGLVTNGTLLHKHQDLIRNAALSHMDISLDGIEEDHDAIRGAGSFARVRENVRWAADLMGDRLFATMTLQKRNLERVGEAVQSFAGLGLRNVGISPFEKLSYNDHSLALSPEDLRFFFASLRHLERLNLPHELFVQADACIVEPQALLAFMESEWFDLDSMKIDGTGFLYCRHSLSNGITLSFRFLPWPFNLDSSVRITADGELLAVEDARHPRTHHINTLANLRDFDFDFGAAFRAASGHPRLALIDAAFEAQLAPRIRAAYLRQERSGRLTRLAMAV